MNEQLPPRKMVPEETYRYSTLTGSSLRGIREEVDSLIASFGDGATIYLDINNSYPVGMYIHWDRPETDEEYAKRLKRMEADKQRRLKEKAEKPLKEAARKAKLVEDCRELADQLGFKLINKDSG